MKRLREFANQLGGSGWFVGLALALEGRSARWAPDAAQLAWAVAIGWAVYGLAVLVHRDRTTAVFRRPRSFLWWGWVPGGHQLALRTRMDFASRSRRVDRRISQYLSNMLGDAGRATILTRDMSWAAGATGALERLAESGDLDIITSGRRSRTAPEIERLERLGAQVHVIDDDVLIRFTLVRRGGKEALALARTGTSRHTIIHKSNPQDPVFVMAVELAKALMREARG